MTQNDIQTLPLSKFETNNGQIAGLPKNPRIIKGREARKIKNTGDTYACLPANLRLFSLTNQYLKIIYYPRLGVSGRSNQAVPREASRFFLIKTADAAIAIDAIHLMLKPRDRLAEVSSGNLTPRHSKIISLIRFFMSVILSIVRVLSTSPKGGVGYLGISVNFSDRSRANSKRAGYPFGKLSQ